MAVWKSKSCPECGNDLLIQLETAGWFEECLWCGYERNVSHLVVISTDEPVKPKSRILTNERIYTNVQVTGAN